MFVFKGSFHFKLGCRMQNVPENPEKSSCGSYMSAGMFQKVTLDILRIIFSQARGPVQWVSGHDYGLHKDLLSG